jgi:hypothetical protein
MYNLITVYDDGFTKSEICRNITEIFSAAAIYTQDEECTSVIGINVETKEFVIDFTRR